MLNMHQKPSPPANGVAKADGIGTTDPATGPPARTWLQPLSFAL